jgi:hypothetical protein
MAGVEVPHPGSDVFQRMFSVLLHFIGKSRAGVMLSAVGPRHWGQTSSGETVSAGPAKSKRPRIVACIEFGLHESSIVGNTPGLFLLWSAAM